MLFNRDVTCNSNDFSLYIYTQLSHPHTHKTEKLRIKFTCIEHLKPIEVSGCKGDYFKFQICCYGKTQLFLMLKVWKVWKKIIRSIKDFWTPDFFWKFILFILFKFILCTHNITAVHKNIEGLLTKLWYACICARALSSYSCIPAATDP